jgi:hypothetical protein
VTNISPHITRIAFSGSRTVIVEFHTMSTIPNATGEDSSSMVYRLMSQGVNAVVARTFLRMESKYDEAMADMQTIWQAKLDDMASNAKAEIQALKTDLEETKIALNDIRSECLDWKSLYQQKCASTEQVTYVLTLEQIQDDFNTKLRSLSSTIKVMVERIVDHQSILAWLQKNVDNFYLRYNDRNSTIDSLLSQTKTEIGDVINALAVVEDNTKGLTQDFKVMKHVFYHNIDAVQSKLDECIELNSSEKIAICESFVSIDEHNQLRSNLEDQLLECSMKFDHVLLRVQQQYEETKSRCDELQIISEISRRNKKRHEKSNEDQEKYRLSNHATLDDRNFDDVIQVDTKSIALDLKKIHEKLEKDDRNLIDDTSTVDLDESFVDDVDDGKENEYIGHSVSNAITTKDKIARVEHTNEFDDEDSLFGGRVNLVFLSEMNIHG